MDKPNRPYRRTPHNDNYRQSGGHPQPHRSGRGRGGRTPTGGRGSGRGRGEGPYVWDIDQWDELEPPMVSQIDGDSAGKKEGEDAPEKKFVGEFTIGTRESELTSQSPPNKKSSEVEPKSSLLTQQDPKSKARRLFRR